MASLELTARLRFLNEAAHLLLVPAPETSRHLMSKHTSLLSQHDLDTPERRKESCGACGTIMVIGWEGNLQVEPVVGKKQATTGKMVTGKVALKQQKTMIYICDSCRRTTRFPLDLPTKPPRHVSSSHPQSATILAGRPPTMLSAPTVLSSSIKKRTKSKKGGLAAILAKQKESQSVSTGFGLDLMDFMKKS